MSIADQLFELGSPFAYANLSSPEIPHSGLAIPVPKYCEKVFSGGKCAAFYRDIAREPLQAGPIQCPYGFAAWPIRLGRKSFAVTGLIPFPRLGGERERARAKDAPENRVEAKRVSLWVAQVAHLHKQLEEQEALEMSKTLGALHEVRRLNQTVVVVLERQCSARDGVDAGVEDDDLVRAWKASELISLQMDALDVLSNPAMHEASPRDERTFFKVVDKTVRIYRPSARKKNVDLRLSGASVSKVRVFGKTFHIIPSVFIDNAIKYAPNGTRVDVSVFEEDVDEATWVGLEVVSEGPPATEDEEKQLLHRRLRGTAARSQAEGSGNGLLIAKIVADQHAGRITVVQKRLNPRHSRWKFRFMIQRLTSPKRSPSVAGVPSR